MNYQFEYNQRQFQQMLHTIRAYRPGDFEVGGLIANLDALIGLLEGFSEEQRNQFRRPINIIDEVWAIALDRDKTTFDS